MSKKGKPATHENELAGALRRIATCESELLAVRAELSRTQQALQIIENRVSHLSLSDTVVDAINARGLRTLAQVLLIATEPPAPAQPPNESSGEQQRSQNLAVTGSGTGVTNGIILVAVYTPSPFVLAAVRMRFQSNGGGGYYDTGIYDATGANDGPNNLLGHAAATNTSLPVASSGVKTPALIGGNLSLSAGRYWLAYWQSNANDQIVNGAGDTGMPPFLTGTSNGPLPALASSIGSLANTNMAPLLEGLRAGGWS